MSTRTVAVQRTRTRLVGRVVDYEYSSLNARKQCSLKWKRGIRGGAARSARHSELRDGGALRQLLPPKKRRLLLHDGHALLQ